MCFNIKYQFNVEKLPRKENTAFCMFSKLLKIDRKISDPRPEVNFKSYKIVFKNILMNVVQDKRS